MTDITGTAGNDVLNNGTGGGTMTGLGGDDIYEVNNAGDVVVESPNGGYDTVESTISYTLPDNVEYFYLTGLTEADTAVGNDQDNQIFGQQGTFASVLDGRGGDDGLFALGSGDNTLIGGTGNDSMHGGYGNDTYMFHLGDGQDTIVETADTDRIVFDSSVDSSSVTYVQNGYDLEIYYGAGSDKITVTSFYYTQSADSYVIESVQFSDGTVHDDAYINSHLSSAPPLPPVDVSGTSGDDVLDNGANPGTMTGFAGDDTYIVNNPGDVVAENPNEGFDTVQSTISYTLPDNVEYFYLTGLTEPDTAIGNDQSNQIFGQQGTFGSVLDGRGGDDALFALGAGNDTLTGGTGDDSMFGGYGNDTYLFSSGDGQDTVGETDGTDRIVFDATVSAATVSYSRVVDNLVISYGNGDQITVLGYFQTPEQTADEKKIETVEFADGTVHDDAYIESHLGVPPANDPPVAVDDAFTQAFGHDIAGNVLADNGNGADSDPNGDALTVTTSSVITDHGATVSISAGGDFTYTAPEDFLGTDSFSYAISDGHGGADTATVSLQIVAPTGATLGTAGNDVFGGTAANDVILGLAGNDTINGGSGNDTLYGGSGNDSLQGGSGNDALFGGDGNDVLKGGSGDDLFDGGNGADTFTGGSGRDSYVFTAATAFNGADTITDFSKGDGDKLNISDVLAGHYNPSTDALTNFVQITDDGHNSFVKVDLDGAGTAYGWSQIATLTGVTGLTDENALVAGGNLIVA